MLRRTVEVVSDPARIVRLDSEMVENGSEVGSAEISYACNEQKQGANNWEWTDQMVDEVFSLWTITASPISIVES